MSLISVNGQSGFAGTAITRADDSDLERKSNIDRDNLESLDGLKRRRVELSSNGFEAAKESRVFTQSVAPTSSDSVRAMENRAFPGFVVVQKTLAEKEAVFHFIHSQASSFFESKNYTEAKSYYINAHIMISHIIDCYKEANKPSLHLENIEESILLIISQIDELIAEPLLHFNPRASLDNIESLSSLFEHIISQNQTELPAQDKSFKDLLKQGIKSLKRKKINEAEKTFISALKLKDAKEGPKRVLIHMLLAEVNIMLADEAFLSNNNEIASNLYSNANDYLNIFNPQYLKDDFRDAYDSMETHIELYSNQLKNPFSYAEGFEQAHPKMQRIHLSWLGQLVNRLFQFRDYLIPM